MSNPYAPPEGGSRAGAPTEAPGDGSLPPTGALPTGAPPTEAPQAGPPAGPPARPPAGPPSPANPSANPSAGQPDRSPEGVPYERPRGAAPQGPAPQPADVHRVAVLTRAAALLVLAAVLADLLSFPWHVAAVPIAVAAVAVGGRALAVATRTRVRNAPRAVLGLLIVVAVLALMRPAQTALTWDAESAFAQCRSGALTTQAQNGCLSRYEQAVTDRLKELQQRQP